jgi:hypothetical protein
MFGSIKKKKKAKRKQKERKKTLNLPTAASGAIPGANAKVAMIPRCNKTSTKKKTKTAVEESKIN